MGLGVELGLGLGELGAQGLDGLGCLAGGLVGGVLGGVGVDRGVGGGRLGLQRQLALTALRLLGGEPGLLEAGELGGDSGALTCGLLGQPGLLGQGGLHRLELLARSGRGLGLLGGELVGHAGAGLRGCSRLRGRADRLVLGDDLVVVGEGGGHLGHLDRLDVLEGLLDRSVVDLGRRRPGVGGDPADDVVRLVRLRHRLRLGRAVLAGLGRGRQVGRPGTSHELGDLVGVDDRGRFLGVAAAQQPAQRAVPTARSVVGGRGTHAADVTQPGGSPMREPARVNCTCVSRWACVKPREE